MYTLETLRDWWQRWTLANLYPNFHLVKWLYYGSRFNRRLAAEELLRRYHQRKLLKPTHRQLGSITETSPLYRMDAALILLEGHPSRFHLRCIIELVPELRESTAYKLLNLGDCSPDDWDLITKRVPAVALISSVRKKHKPLD